MKFMKNGLNPHELGRGISHGLIFSFSARTRYGRLLLGTPRYEIGAEINYKSTSRLSVIY
jgi:hypothetical protein